MAKSKPVHEIRFGTIKAAIWEQEGFQPARYRVTVSKLYKKEDEWNSTGSFGRNDLPLLVKVVDLAHTWMYECGNRADK